jgi:hypothetical protein
MEISISLGFQGDISDRTNVLTLAAPLHGVLLLAFGWSKYWIC